MIVKSSIFKEFKQNILRYNPTKIIIGYSGGVDSHVLLHLTHSVFQNYSKPSISIQAIHINHKLQTLSDSWEQHCIDICNQLNIPIITHQLQQKPPKSQSLEAFAREARYKIIQEYINKNTLFISGHHQSDQAETFLLQLMRGSGIDGLSSMPMDKLFGKGLYVRPLLHIKKTEIIDYANKYQLKYINDPSNEDTQFARNFIRKEILPKLRDFWPQVDKSISQSAKWIAEARNDIKSNDYHSNQTLHIEQLKHLDEINQKQTIRQFFKNKINYSINQNQLHYISQHFLTAKQDKHPELVIKHNNNQQKYIVRRYLDEIIITEPIPSFTMDYQLNIDEILDTPIGQIEWQKGEGFNPAIINKSYPLHLKLVNLSDRFHPHNRQHSQIIKKILLEQKTPYWLRQTVPAFYYKNELVAIAGIAVAKHLYVKDKNALMPVWKLKQKFVTI